MELDALVERILLDIDGVFKKDPNLDEFGFLPVPVSSQNKSPVVHEEHNLGLEAWCVQHIYMYAYTRLFSWKENKIKLDLSSIQNCSRILVLLNPDLSTAWNVRKELVVQGHLKEHQELTLSRMALTYKPKTADAFIHRRWVIERLLKQADSSDLLRSLLEPELDLCTLTATRYFSNYHSWNHRLWSIEKLTVGRLQEVVESELTWSEQWLQRKVSDHSGIQYRQSLIRMLISSESGSSSQNSPQTLVRLLDKELKFIGELITEYPTHEALWCHRRYVLYSVWRNKLLVESSDRESDCSLQFKRFKSDVEEKFDSVTSVVEERRFLGQFVGGQVGDGSGQVGDLVEKYKTWLFIATGINLR